MQNLIDQWFLQGTNTLMVIADKCMQGEIEFVNKVNLIMRVGHWFANQLNLERDDLLANWSKVEEICLDVVITWQANVVTTGNEFFSNISVGTERQYPKGIPSLFVSELEVEYINGFWLDTCVPTSGSASLAYEISWEGGLNLASEGNGIDEYY